MPVRICCDTPAYNILFDILNPEVEEKTSIAFRSISYVPMVINILKHTNPLKRDPTGKLKKQFISFIKGNIEERIKKWKEKK